MLTPQALEKTSPSERRRGNRGERHHDEPPPSALVRDTEVVVRRVEDDAGSAVAVRCSLPASAIRRWWWGRSRGTPPAGHRLQGEVHQHPGPLRDLAANPVGDEPRARPEIAGRRARPARKRAQGGSRAVGDHLGIGEIVHPEPAHLAPSHGMGVHAEVVTARRERPHAFRVGDHDMVAPAVDLADLGIRRGSTDEARTLSGPLPQARPNHCRSSATSCPSRSSRPRRHAAGARLAHIDAQEGRNPAARPHLSSFGDPSAPARALAGDRPAASAQTSYSRFARPHRPPLPS